MDLVRAGLNKQLLICKLNNHCNAVMTNPKNTGVMQIYPIAFEWTVSLRGFFVQEDCITTFGDYF